MKCKDIENVIGHLEVDAAAITAPYRRPSEATAVAVFRIYLQYKYKQQNGLNSTKFSDRFAFSIIDIGINYFN